MEAEHPLMREAFPEFVAELVALLEEDGERELAACAWDLRIVADRGCADDFCQSFYTGARPDGPYGPGHRTVCLSPRNGMLNLDVVNGRIMYVEVINRSPLGNGR